MRPNRIQLEGMSLSEFKTMLKRKGHKVPRNFCKYGCVSKYKNRLYRWRYWANVGFVVDISCLMPEFDRWANSAVTFTFDEWVRGA